MSRIRSIHPGLWTDERFVCASPMARLFFMGLWNECDDYGSFEWSPLKLKMRLLPADNADAAALLAELEEAGSVMRYEASGKAFGAVRNFCQYQRPKKPHAAHPQDDLARQWVNIDARSSPDSSEPVPNQSPTASEIPPQRKDEGGRVEEEVSPSGDCPSDDEPELTVKHVFEYYQELATELALTVPRDLTPERRQLIQARINHYPLGDFLTVFAKCRGSPFLRGDRGRTPLSIDWLMKKGNFQKVLEGNYDR
jgi:hypothetical protein